MKYGLYLLFLTFSYTAWSSPAEEPEETRITILHAIDDIVGNNINNVANDFDSFFATERADDELGRSRVRIRGSYRIAERALPDDDVQFRFNLRLPYLEQKFRYEMEDTKKEKKAKTKEELAELRKNGPKETSWMKDGSLPEILALTFPCNRGL